MGYKLVYDVEAAHILECDRLLRENVKYRLLSYEDAKSKAISIHGGNVMYGYNPSLYEERKGGRPFVYLVHTDWGWRLKHNPTAFKVSIDMLEPYPKIIKYNKD